jgi:phage FluMu protein Com
MPQQQNTGGPPVPHPQQQQRQFPCKQCGGLLTFAPGMSCLKCPYCGTENEIAGSTETVEELDFNRALVDLANSAETVETLNVKCNTCGAESSLPPGTTAGSCPFCGQPIVAEAMTKRLIKPKSLLPFVITREQAVTAFRNWLAGLWFAPSYLASAAEHGKITGAYIPAWTYDCDAATAYTGERGEHYWVTETYTETIDGKEVTQTREVQRTRWSPASGTVQDQFDDILVMASNSLPPRCRDHLEPWDLKSLVPYQDEYLSGFVAETYQLDLPGGFDRAKIIMQPVIRRSVESDIGGDEQRVSSMGTDYRDITFKHILLPLWISAYILRGVTYRFLVNARTGKVAGERPYSAWKITLLVLAILVAIVIAFAIANRR